MIHEHHMSLRATIQDFSIHHTGGIIHVHSYSHYFPPPLGQIGATYIHVVTHRESHPYFTDQGSLVPSLLSRTQREGIWTNVYRARIARTMYSVLQSDARIKSHDCAGMTGMQINDCGRACLLVSCTRLARLYMYAIEPLVPNGTLH